MLASTSEPTLYALVVRVLEQTTALSETQASITHTLDELKRSIPAPEEIADIRARLGRVEGLVATLARADTDLPVHQSNQRAHRPDSALAHISDTPRSNPPTSPQETVVRDAGAEHTHRRAPVADKAPAVIPPPGRFDRLTPDLVLQDHHTLLHAPSDTDLQGQNPATEVKQQPPITSSRPHTTQDPSSTCAISSLEATQTTKQDEQVHSANVHEHESLHEDRNNVVSLRDGPLRTPPSDSNNEPSLTDENFPWVVVTERDEALCSQLPDLARTLQQMLGLCAEHKVMLEQQWSARLHWMEECDMRSRELVRMTSWLVEERVVEKQSGAHQGQSNDVDARTENIADKIQDWKAEHRELFQALSDSWRADSTRQHEETIDVVRAMANEQVPYNIQGYLDEFSKALSIDVRMLLSEVGKLREERRRIQHEVGYLMMMQSTLVDGGEFGPPAYASPEGWPSPAGIPLPESPPIRPAWRVVPPRGSRRVRRPAPPPPERQARSWATWNPNPQLAPTPPSAEATLLVPDRGSPGLFGPRTPHDSPPRTPPREVNERCTAIPRVPSWVTWPDPLFAHDRTAWATWQPNPQLAPTPPSVEPTPLVPERYSPGLFGPRSPRYSPRTPPGEVEWAAWRPRRASTSSSVAESNLFVPDPAADSPGLFGPRSPRGSWADLTALPTGEPATEAPRLPDAFEYY